MIKNLNEKSTSSYPQIFAGVRRIALVALWEDGVRQARAVSLVVNAVVKLSGVVDWVVVRSRIYSIKDEVSRMTIKTGETWSIPF